MNALKGKKNLKKPMLKASAYKELILVYQLRTNVDQPFNKAFESDQRKKRRTVYLSERHLKVLEAISFRENISLNEVVRRLTDNIILSNRIYECSDCGHFFFNYDVNNINEFQCSRCGSKSFLSVKGDLNSD